MAGTAKKVLRWFFSSRGSDFGILILRVFIGVSFTIHGYPKIIGGTEKWIKLGGAMKNVGIDFAPVFWGFCAAFAEFFGGLALAAGVMTRAAASGIGFAMVIAAIMHLSKGDPSGKIQYPLELLGVCIFFIFSGAGKWAIDFLIAKKFEK